MRKSLTWRERKAHFGEMVQMDGSHHDWLEQRGPKLVLMGSQAGSTANSTAMKAAMPAMDSLKGYIKQNGIPKSIYLDRHSTYKNNKKYSYTDWPFRDKEELTQFGRACKQLGIELIYANSPQAKGRVERVFGTLQDRLTKELRLAKASGCKEANIVLERFQDSFNSKFQVVAKRSGDLHSPVDKRTKLDDILSFQTQRALRNDRTMLHNKRWYQVLNRTRAQNITVYDYLNGRMSIKYDANRLDYKAIKGPIIRMAPVKLKTFKLRFPKRYVPPRDSYWRIGFKLPGSLRTKIGHF